MCLAICRGSAAWLYPRYTEFLSNPTLGISDWRFSSEKEHALGGNNRNRDLPSFQG